MILKKCDYYYTYFLKFLIQKIFIPLTLPSSRRGEGLGEGDILV